jgi:hypothetical protein
LDSRGAGEVAGVGKSSEDEQVPVFDLAGLDGPVESDGYRGAEHVAAFLEGVQVSFGG